MTAADPSASAAQDRWAEATQLKLTWWRFRRPRLAVISPFVIIIFDLIAAFADFLAINDPHTTDARRSFIPPQAIHFFDENGFNPHVYGLRGMHDRQTFQLVYTPPTPGVVGLSPAFMGVRVVSERLENVPARTGVSQHIRSPWGARPE